MFSNGFLPGPNLVRFTSLLTSSDHVELQEWLSSPSLVFSSIAAMSFGYSVGDFVALVQLRRTVTAVSREVYGRYVCIPRMLCVLSSFPRSERETLLLVLAVAPVLPARQLLVDYAARPPHVVAPVLPCPLLLFDFAARPPHVVAPVLPCPLLLFDFAARPPHGVVPVLAFRWLLEAASQDAQNPIPVWRTFCRYGFILMVVYVGGAVISWYVWMIATRTEASFGR